MTIKQMMKDSEAHGKHTFDRDTMRFWGANVLTDPDKYGIYIESIDNFNREKKIYCVKAYNKKNGDVVTFNNVAKEQFSTLKEAEKCADSIRAQIKKNFDHFECNYSLGIDIMYYNDKRQTVMVEDT